MFFSLTGLYEYSFKTMDYELLLNAVILSKSFSCLLWENSKYVVKQLEKIGPALAKNLVAAKLISFNDIEKSDPRTIEMVCACTKSPKVFSTIGRFSKKLEKNRILFLYKILMFLQLSST